MTAESRLLEMLLSPHGALRYEACELLRVAPSLSPASISALQQAASDPDPDVAERAAAALAIHLAPSQLTPPPVHRRGYMPFFWTMPLVLLGFISFLTAAVVSSFMSSVDTFDYDSKQRLESLAAIPCIAGLAFLVLCIAAAVRWAERGSRPYLSVVLLTIAATIWPLLVASKLAFLPQAQGYVAVVVVALDILIAVALLKPAQEPTKKETR